MKKRTCIRNWVIFDNKGQTFEIRFGEEYFISHEDNKAVFLYNNRGCCVPLPAVCFANDVFVQDLHDIIVTGGRE